MRIDLSQARELARKALLSAAEGRDPSEEKKAAKRDTQQPELPRHLIVDNVISEFIKRHVSANTRKSTAKEVSRILNVNALPVWRGRNIHNITRSDIIELLDEMIDRGASVSANRTLAVVRRMFNWCIERNLITSSPCERISAPTTEKARDRILSDEELRALWQACIEIGWPFGPLVQLLILTGQRRTEVAEAQWIEMDLQRGLWTIPRERMKNDQGHDVALSNSAVTLLQSLPRVSGPKSLVFSTTGETAVSGFSRAKRRLDESMLKILRKEAEKAGQDWTNVKLTDWRIHDVRRTVASGMARLGINLPVIEKVLNHSSGSFGGIVSVYQRHSFSEEKRAALLLWGDFVNQTCSKNSMLEATLEAN
jgi:integrase